MRGFSTPIEFGEVAIALTGNAHQPHGVANDILGCIRTSKPRCIDKQGVQDFGMLMETMELHDQLSIRRGVHACAKCRQHGRI